MDGVSVCEAKVWQVLKRAKGWLTSGKVACEAGIASQTTYCILDGLAHLGLVVKVRTGLPCYYRLVGAQTSLRREHEKRVAETCRVHTIPIHRGECGKRGRAA